MDDRELVGDLLASCSPSERERIARLFADFVFESKDTPTAAAVLAIESDTMAWEEAIRDGWLRRNERRRRTVPLVRSRAR